jgi:hypothetical protein
MPSSLSLPLDVSTAAMRNVRSSVRQAYVSTAAMTNAHPSTRQTLVSTAVMRNVRLSRERGHQGSIIDWTVPRLGTPDCHTATGKIAEDIEVFRTWTLLAQQRRGLDAVRAG